MLPQIQARGSALLFGEKHFICDAETMQNFIHFYAIFTAKTVDNVLKIRMVDSAGDSL